MILERVYNVFGCEPPHNQRLLAVGGRPDWTPINPLHVFRDASTTIHFHNKFGFYHWFHYIHFTLRSDSLLRTAFLFNQTVTSITFVKAKHGIALIA